MVKILKNRNVHNVVDILDIPWIDNTEGFRGNNEFVLTLFRKKCFTIACSCQYEQSWSRAQVAGFQDICVRIVL